MRYLITLFTLTLATTVSADTLTLRSGQVVNGTYLGGTARSIKMEVGDSIQNYDVADVTRLEFNANAPQSSDAPPPPPPPPDPPPPQAAVAPPAPAAPQASGALGLTIPAGTNFVIRMIDAVDSEKNRAGDTFRASMDEPVIVNGQTVISRGADVVVKLVDNKESGKLTGTTQLALNLQSVSINGTLVDINTQSVTKSSASRGARTAKLAGGGAVLGAIIGGIAGGGRGAAIGAGAGAATGAGVEVATKGQQVHVPSETRITFSLDTSVNI